MTRLQDDGFLSRWSRLKLDKKDSEKSNESQLITNDFAKDKQTKPDNLSLPIWQQKDIDSDIKKQALKSIFRRPEFNNLDGLNDYDEDYTVFSSLGDVITEEMRRMLRLVEANEHTNAQLLSHKVAVQPNEQVTNQDLDENDDDEDSKLA